MLDSFIYSSFASIEEQLWRQSCQMICCTWSAGVWQTRKTSTRCINALVPGNNLLYLLWRVRIGELHGLSLTNIIHHLTQDFGQNSQQSPHNRFCKRRCCVIRTRKDHRDCKMGQHVAFNHYVVSGKDLVQLCSFRSKTWFWRFGTNAWRCYVLANNIHVSHLLWDSNTHMLIIKLADSSRLRWSNSKSSAPSERPRQNRNRMFDWMALLRRIL